MNKSLLVRASPSLQEHHFWLQKQSTTGFCLDKTTKEVY